LFNPGCRQSSINQNLRLGVRKKVVQNLPSGARDANFSKPNQDGVPPGNIKSFANINESTERSLTSTQPQSFGKSVDLLLCTPPEACLALINLGVHTREHAFQQHPLKDFEAAT
jgi:hypothetical protein